MTNETMRGADQLLLGLLSPTEAIAPKDLPRLATSFARADIPDAPCASSNPNSHVGRLVLLELPWFADS